MGPVVAVWSRSEGVLCLPCRQCYDAGAGFSKSTWDTEERRRTPTTSAYVSVSRRTSASQSPFSGMLHESSGLDSELQVSANGWTRLGEADPPILHFSAQIKRAAMTAALFGSNSESKKRYFFLRHAIRPSAPRPVPRRRSDVGSGMTLAEDPVVVRSAIPM